MEGLTPTLFLFQRDFHPRSKAFPSLTTHRGAVTFVIPRRNSLHWVCKLLDKDTTMSARNLITVQESRIS